MENQGPLGKEWHPSRLGTLCHPSHAEMVSIPPHLNPGLPWTLTHQESHSFPGGSHEPRFGPGTSCASSSTPPCFGHGPRSKHVCVLKVLPHLTLKAHTRQDPLPAHSTDVEMKMWRSFRHLSNLTPQVRSGATPQALWHQIPPHSRLQPTPVLPLPLDWSSPETKHFCGLQPPRP